MRARLTILCGTLSLSLLTIFGVSFALDSVALS